VTQTQTPATAPEPVAVTVGLPRTEYGAHTWLELRELAAREEVVVVIPTDWNENVWSDWPGAGPLSYMPHWSGLTRSGVMGDPTVATAEKGRVLLERARVEAAAFIAEAVSRPRAPGVDHHEGLKR
jgi:creatinine amidohydrolase/Fe(II)-dependent formamide hydrolase-like protein